MIIALTGSTGSMGKETLKSLGELNETVRILIRNTKKNRKYVKSVKKTFKDRLEVYFGDIRNYDDCLAFTKGADYVLHVAAIIPPKADHDDKATIETNYHGTKNMVDAVIANGNTAKFVHISTVALYGNRDEKHPYGRVGDPLLVSMFDVYGTSKLQGERYLLEAGLNNWAVLRQSGILYDNMLMNNISDGLMFHTPWNVPIEWATAKDSGILMKNIVKQDMANECPTFWKRVYNIGGGEKCRTTGYETFDAGFKLIGGSCKKFFEPQWNAYQNFHCFWYADSDVLEDMFHFRTQGCDQFWSWFASRHKIYGAGKIVPASWIRKLAIEPLLKNNNSPKYWEDHGLTARTYAIFGEKKVSNKWEDFELLCEKENYQEIKKWKKEYDLDHGYDETKPDSELDIEDMKKAAAFRGGECLSETMVKGDLYTKLLWRCHDGHEFLSSPYTILKAGHWCPECSMPTMKWEFDRLAKTNPFFAQVWYDTHSPKDNVVYEITTHGPTMEKK